MTIQEFIREQGIKMTCDYASSNPNAADSDWSRAASHYKCLLSNKAGRQLTVYFSMGSAHTSEPKPEDVLDCLASDSAGIENARSFEDWCGDYGYNTDSRKAEKIYNTCERQARKLKQFLGDASYKALLWDIERM